MPQIKFGTPMKGLFLVSFVALIATPLFSFQLTPLERATHIVHGKVIASDCKFAGGVIAMTETKIKVWDILKNSDDQLASGDVVTIMGYGCFDGDLKFSDSENEMVLLRVGSEVVLPLLKYYDHYKMFKSSEPFAIGHVFKNRVSLYDESALSQSGPISFKERFIQNQNQKWKDEEPENDEKIGSALFEDLLLREKMGNVTTTSSKTLGAYLNVLKAKADLSGVNGARRAPLVVKVQVQSLTFESKDGESSAKVVFTWLEDVKGRLGKQTLTLSLPGVSTASAYGFRLPKIGDKGLLLMKNPETVYPVPEYFTILENDESIHIGSDVMNSNQWKRSLAPDR